MLIPYYGKQKKKKKTYLLKKIKMNHEIRVWIFLKYKVLD